MCDSIPRFEFRAFAQSFGLVTEKLRGQSVCSDISESVETYIVAGGVEDENVKVRDDRLEMKRMIEQRGPLERWEPCGEETFPVSRGFLERRLLPILGVKNVKLKRKQYSIAELIREIVETRLDVSQARVFKRRFRFSRDECLMEIVELLVNGAAISSVAVESKDPDSVLAMVNTLGLGEYDNVNYPRAIRRIMGLEQLANRASDGHRD